MEYQTTAQKLLAAYQRVYYITLSYLREDILIKIRELTNLVEIDPDIKVTFSKSDLQELSEKEPRFSNIIYKKNFYAHTMKRNEKINIAEWNFTDMNALYDRAATGEEIIENKLNLEYNMSDLIWNAEHGRWEA